MVFNLGSGIPLEILKINQKSLLYITISIVKTATNLTLNIVFLVYDGMGGMGGGLGGLITRATVGIFVLVYQIRQTKISYSFNLLKPMLKYGIPIVWSSLGMFIVNFGDRIFLQRMTSLSEMGVYSLAYRFGFLPMIIAGPFMMVWVPKRFDLIKEPNAKSIYSVFFTYYLFILIYTGLGICTLIKDAIIIIADP